MSKYIRMIPQAHIANVEPKGTVSEDWESRKAYIGTAGALYVMDGAPKAPGKQFVILIDEESWFRTSAGDLTEENGILRLETGNSVYTFAIDDGGLTAEKTVEMLKLLYKYGYRE